MNKGIIKFISIIVAISFLSQGIAWSIPSNQPLSISHEPSTSLCIPEQYGRVDKSMDYGRWTMDPKSPMVILIKDAHCHYEAQRNIVKILDILIKEYKIDLVCVEGASGIVDPSIIAQSPDAKRRKDVADKYMKKGWLTASEVLAMEKDKDYGFSIWGVEDLKLYLEDLKAFRDVYTGSEEANRFIEIANKRIAELKNKLYPEELQSFDKKYQLYRENKLPLSEYIKELKDSRPLSGNIRLVVRAMELEEKIDFKKVEKERAELIRQIEKIMPKEEIGQLVKKSLEYRLGKIPQLEYYRYLKPKTINLLRYVHLLKLQSKIDEDVLFKEIDKITEEVYGRGPALTMRLHEIDRKVYLLGKLVRLEITRDELEEIRDSIHDISEYLNIEEAGDFFSQPQRFYEYALQRDKALVDNLLRKMKDKAVLVVGGFHADGIEKLLRGKGIQVITITPSITKEDSEAKRIYLSRIMDDRIHLDKMFKELGVNNIGAPVLNATESPWWGSYRAVIEMIGEELSGKIRNSTSIGEARRVLTAKDKQVIRDFMVKVSREIPGYHILSMLISDGEAAKEQNTGGLMGKVVDEDGEILADIQGGVIEEGGQDYLILMREKRILRKIKCHKLEEDGRLGLIRMVLNELSKKDSWKGEIVQGFIRYINSLDIYELTGDTQGIAGFGGNGIVCIHEDIINDHVAAFHELMEAYLKANPRIIDIEGFVRDGGTIHTLLRGAGKDVRSVLEQGTVTVGELRNSGAIAYEIEIKLRKEQLKGGRRRLTPSEHALICFNCRRLIRKYKGAWNLKEINLKELVYGYQDILFGEEENRKLTLKIKALEKGENYGRVYGHSEKIQIFEKGLILRPGIKKKKAIRDILGEELFSILDCVMRNTIVYSSKDIEWIVVHALTEYFGIHENWYGGLAELIAEILSEEKYLEEEMKREWAEVDRIIKAIINTEIGRDDNIYKIIRRFYTINEKSLEQYIIVIHGLREELCGKIKEYLLETLKKLEKDFPGSLNIKVRNLTGSGITSDTIGKYLTFFNKVRAKIGEFGKRIADRGSMNYYEILGVPQDATQDEIRTAYRKLARRYHPDIKGGNGGEMIQKLNEAYAVLSDPERRAHYDRTGRDLPLRKQRNCRGYGGETNEELNEDVIMAIDREEFACVLVEGENLVLKPLKMDDGEEITGRFILSEEEMANMRQAIDRLYELHPEDGDILQSLTLVFIEFSDEGKAHYGLKRQQIYMDKRLLAEGKTDALTRRLHHELQERHRVIERMEKRYTDWKERRSEEEIKEAIREETERVHRELVIEEIAEALKLDRAKVEDILKDEGITIELLHNLRALLTRGDISSNELNEKLQVILDSADRVVKIFNMIEKDLPEDIKGKKSIIEQSLAMYIAVNKLEKLEKTKNEEKMPLFLKKLGDSLRGLAPDRGIDPNMVNGLIGDLYKAEGYYVEGDDIRPSPYFELVVDWIGVVFGLKETDENLEMLNKYKYTKALVRKVFGVDKGDEAVSNDGIVKAVKNYIERKRLARGKTAEDSRAEKQDALRYLMDVISRYTIDPDDISRFFTEEEDVSNWKLVKRGLDSILGAKGEFKDIKPPNLATRLAESRDDEGTRRAYITTVKAYKEAERGLRERLNRNNAGLRSNAMNIIDAKLLIGNIEDKEGGRYSFQSLGEGAVTLLKEWAERKILKIKYDSGRKGELEVVKEWLKAHGVEIENNIFIAEYLGENQKAVCMLSEETYNSCKEANKISKQRVIIGKVGESDMLFMSCMAAILGSGDDVTDHMIQLFCAYYDVNNIKELDEDLKTAVDNVLKALKKGGRIEIVLPPISPFMRTYCNMLNVTRQIVSVMA